MKDLYVMNWKKAGLNTKRQVLLPVVYKEVKIDCGCRLDIIVDESVIVEPQTVKY